MILPCFFHSLLSSEQVLEQASAAAGAEAPLQPLPGAQSHDGHPGKPLALGPPCRVDRGPSPG